MAVVNTYFQKRGPQSDLYKSGGRSPQIDYILCRRCNLREIRDCGGGRQECSQTALVGSVQNNDGDEEKEEREDRAENQAVKLKERGRV